MKVCVFLLFLFLINIAKAKTYADMFNIVYRNKLYYSSYTFLKKSAEKKLEVSKEKVNRILDVIHPSVFIHDSDLDKFIDKNTQLDYAVGMRRFFLNDFETAKKKLSALGKTSVSLEASYILGLIYLTENKIKKANSYFKSCVRNASRKKETAFKPESYIHIFRNRCIQQIGRIHFANKKYLKSLKILNYVKKDDYIWPRFLIDKAWSYYWLGENERALGSVMTYKAPLLRRFMSPEVNYLRALIFYEMCYFEKTEKIYSEFNETTWKYRNAAKRTSKNRLLRLIVSKNEPLKEKDKFLYYYLKGFKKDIRFHSFKQARQRITNEIKKLSKVKSLKQARVFLDFLYFYKKAIKEDFQDFLKNVSQDYYQQIKQTRSSFVKLNLMVSLKKRELLAKGKSTKFKDIVNEQKLSAISNTKDKFIWDFRGGFWADEIGDYAVALNNRCI